MEKAKACKLGYLKLDAGRGLDVWDYLGAMPSFSLDDFRRCFLGIQVII
jgi:hypothetical protein